MPSLREDELLVKAARLYFDDGLSQQQVAQVLGLSRSNVSRVLAAARERGIVQIRIVDPAGRDSRLEAELTETFDLAEVRVAAFRPGVSALSEVGRLGADWIADNVVDGQTLALSWGMALQHLVYSVHAEQPRKIEIVQLVGGLSPAEMSATGQELVRELAARTGATYRYLHAPAVLDSAGATAALRRERSISAALDAACAAQIALVGIGSTGFGSSQFIVESMKLSARELKQFQSADAAGDICARFYDIDGRPIPGPVDDRVLGVTLADLRRMPTVVGVAAGAEKAPGLLGAVRGHHLGVLICDAGLARAVLALARKYPVARDHTSAAPNRRKANP